jgi:hypothetical protein
MGKHFRISREFALQAQRRGDSVHIIVCDGDLEVCPAKNNSDVPPCILCRSKRKRTLHEDFGYTVSKHTLNLNKYRGKFCLPSFNSVEELKQYSLDGVDHGLAAASTVISRLRDPNPDLHQHRDLVKQSLFTSVATYYEITRLIESLDISTLHIQNGRRASQRPALRAGQRKGITVYVGEDGHNSSNCYIKAVNTYPHDLKYIKKNINKSYNNSKNNKEIKENAQKFFNERRYGSEKIIGEAHYTEDQCLGKIPDNLHQRYRNIAIFNSSEDEFVAIEGYSNPIYNNQIEALNRIVKSNQVNDNIRFFLRVHPNLATRDNVQTRMIETLVAPKVTVIPASSDVDTYALMEACDVVLTFGSTMGIESAYYGKPSILVGRAPFEDLGSCYTPTNHEEVINMINNKKLSPLDNFGACQFGHYMIARDEKYIRTDKSNSQFHEGKNHASRFATYWFILRYRGVRHAFKKMFGRFKRKFES